MLSNKILPDESRAGNENRAHVAKAGRYQQMTPRSADGPVAEGGMIHDPNCVRGNEMPPPSRGDAPLFVDPHQNQRGHHQNLTNKPREISPARHQAESRARIYDYGRTNSKSRT